MHNQSFSKAKVMFVPVMIQIVKHHSFYACQEHFHIIMYLGSSDEKGT